MMISEFDVVKNFVTKDKETFELAEMVVKNFAGIKEVMAVEMLTALAEKLESDIGGVGGIDQDWIVKRDLSNITTNTYHDFLRIGRDCWFQQKHHFYIYLSFEEKDCRKCYIGVSGNFKHIDSPFNKLELVQKFSNASAKFPGKISNFSVVRYIFPEYKNEELYKNLPSFYEKGKYGKIFDNIIGRITELIHILEIENDELLSKTNEALARF